MVDDLLGAALDLGVAALYRVEIELGGIGPGRHRACRATAHPDPHAGPPSCTSSVPAGNTIFSVWLAPIVPSPPAIMIGLW